MNKIVNFDLELSAVSVSHRATLAPPPDDDAAPLADPFGDDVVPLGALSGDGRPLGEGPPLSEPPRRR